MPHATPACLNEANGTNPLAPLVWRTRPVISAAARAAATGAIPSSATAMITRVVRRGISEYRTARTDEPTKPAAFTVLAGVLPASATTGSPRVCRSRPSAWAMAPAPTMPIGRFESGTQ